jgi:uncharacterized membrane protein YeaQ/YmgE (transglycosylase-associated protein family)
MSILYWILFGLIAGTIANFIVPNSKLGIIGSIILGIIGAVVGGFLGTLIFGVGITGFNLTSFAVAIGGCILVLLVSRMLLRG